MRGKPEFELLELLWESLRTFKFVYEVEFPKDILKTFLSMSIVRYCSTHSVSRNRRVLSPLLSQARLPHTWNFSGSLLAFSSSLLFSAFLVPHCVLFPLCSFQPFLAPGPSVLLCSVPWTQRAQQGLTSWAGFCVGKWPHPGAPSSSVFLRLWSWSHNIWGGRKGEAFTGMALQRMAVYVPPKGEIEWVTTEVSLGWVPEKQWKEKGPWVMVELKWAGMAAGCGWIHRLKVSPT